MDTALIFPFSLLAFEWPGGDWQTTLRFVIAGFVTYYVALWAAMVWWTFQDSRERTRDPFMQALAVFLVLVFSFAGLVIYLTTRPRLTLADAYARTLEEEALLQELEDLKACPSCRRRVDDAFVICPTCQTSLKEPCSRCAKPLSYSWAACPYCATPRRVSQSHQRRAAIATAPTPAALDGSIVSDTVRVPSPPTNGNGATTPARTPDPLGTV